MARVFITGSADGLGRLAAQTLIQDGHEVVVHARSRDRLTDVQALIVQGAGSVIGDLADIAETHAVARQVNELGAMGAVIHNAGVMSGPSVLAVNVIAPHHQRRIEPHPAVNDRRFQDQLLDALAGFTGTRLA